MTGQLDATTPPRHRWSTTEQSNSQPSVVGVAVVRQKIHDLIRYLPDRVLGRVRKITPGVDLIHWIDICQSQ